MIGDWVIGGGLRMQVTDINNDGYIDLREFKNRSYYRIHFEHLEPILITPELLEKNGFERDKNISLYNAYTGINSRVTLHDDFMSMNSRNMWHVHIDSEDFCTIANCELTYLHELQHLLRICKIDFEFSV